MLKIHNPATGVLLAEVPQVSARIVAERAGAARLAQVDWAARPMRERLEIVQRFRVAMTAEVELLAVTLTREVGKPISQSRQEINGLLTRIDFFLAHAEAALAPQSVFDDGVTREIISRNALGVIANISAWNYPYFVGGNVFVPALLAGNAVLYKPSEFAVLTGLHIARLWHEAGVPSDVFVPLVGGAAVGKALLAQPLDGVFFTGSHATGRRIANAVGTRFATRLQLELGGKDPIYVCDDVDGVRLRAAAESIADGAMFNNGQSCCAVERIYVHERIHDAFIDAFLAAVRAMPRGDPLLETTYFGAITRAAHLDVLGAQVADAMAKGAQLRLGGSRAAGPGNGFEPTVFTDVDHTMDLMREESFGPMVGIQKVPSDDAALALMNDTRYGLTAGVYSVDEGRAMALLARVNAGSVSWNCCDRVSVRLPWSGVGDSGTGLTLSTLGIQTFTRTRAWHLRRP